MEGTRVARQATDGLRLRVLGGFALEHANERSLAIPNRKACALLAYLALRPERADTRERLAGLLWSNRGEEQARASLRQCLRQLRDLFDQIGFRGFNTARTNVSLGGDINIDLLDLEEQLAGNQIADTLVSGEASPDGILYGYEGLDDAYGTWLQVMRRNWQERLVADLQAHMTGGRGPIARRAAEALVAIDPTHEEAHRHLMRHHADAGNIGAAIKQYTLLWNLLGEEYDMEPALETQALIAEIKSGSYVPEIRETAAQANTAPRPGGGSLRLVGDPSAPLSPRIPVVGISRFQRGGVWSQDAYLIDGFRRELLATMIRFREWVVVEGETLSPSEWESGPARISTHKTVDFQVEGTYYERDGAVHLSITMKDTASQRYVWSELLVLTVANWFSAQQEIVRRISIALNVYLSEDRLTRLVTQPSYEPEIFDKWLQGQQLLTVHWTPDAERSAEAVFKEIIGAAPDFAPAFSSLAAMYNTRHFRNPGRLRTEKDAESALRCAQQSVRLDPLDTRNQLSLAWSNAMHGRFDQAELHFNLTYDLNANSPITLIPSAHGLSFCGMHGQANDLAEAAIRLNPSLPDFHWGYVMCIRLFNEDFEGSIAASEIARDAITDLHAWKAAALAHAGYRREAGETASHFLALARERWTAPSVPTDERILEWFLHCFPIRRKEDRQLLMEGLAMAGLPARSQ